MKKILQVVECVECTGLGLSVYRAFKAGRGDRRGLGRIGYCHLFEI